MGFAARLHRRRRRAGPVGGRLQKGRHHQGFQQHVGGNHHNVVGRRDNHHRFRRRDYDDRPAIPEGTPSVGWCNATSMHIRSGPGTDYGAIGGLVTGEKVDILGREGDWYKIKFKDGKDGVGYVSAQFISSTVVTTTMAPATTTAAPTTAAVQ